MQDHIEARSIMQKFAADTGLSDATSEPRRYLWTDSFAVCNYLTFYRQSGEQQFLKQALSLVDRVHWTLGQQRIDGMRSGWLSNLDEDQARQNTTRGRLRIWQRLDKRRAKENGSAPLDWDPKGST